MRATEILIESMTMWVPDAPRETVDQECEFCDGSGIDSHYNPKTGKRYPFTGETLHKLLIKWDKQLERFNDKLRNLDNQERMIKSFYDANIENHPDLADKMADSFKEISDKREGADRNIKTRMARIQKKMELVQQLETYDCRACKGKGSSDQEVSDAPEMNVSNINAVNLMQALGYESNSGYTIYPKDVPVIKRRIMQLVSTDKLGDYTMKGGTSQKDFGMVRGVDPETGLDKIERKKGATMIGPEIDIEYLKDKFERMMPILDYAQKHDQEIHFA